MQFDRSAHTPREMIGISSSQLDLLGYSQATPQHNHSAQLEYSGVKWTPNTQTNNCSVCNSKFGFFKRRHHCRQCGVLCCDPCSNIRDYVSGYKDQKVRVCTLCNAKNISQKSTVGQAKKNLVMSALTIKNPVPKPYQKR